MEEDQNLHLAIDTEELVRFRAKWKAEITKETNNKYEEKQYGLEMIQTPDKVASLSSSEQKTLWDGTVSVSTSQSYDADELADGFSNQLRIDSVGGHLICESLVKRKMMHISVLPYEVLQLIVSFAVLPDMDLRSLEYFGMVCKGFYMLARDSSIWKKACVRLWGERCNVVDCHGNWRLLYISRPHVHFNGVYVSHSTYVRNGEPSLDKLYQPFHMVHYYRYLWFYPNGTVRYLTSPQEPAQVIEKKSKLDNIDIQFGNYSETGSSKILVVVQDKVQLVRTKGSSPYQHGSRHNHLHNVHKDCSNNGGGELHMEFEIVNLKSSLTSILKWTRFSHRSGIHDGSTSTASGAAGLTEFEINQTHSPFKYMLFKF